MKRISFWKAVEEFEKDTDAKKNFYFIILPKCIEKAKEKYVLDFLELGGLWVRCIRINRGGLYGDARKSLSEIRKFSRAVYIMD